MIQFNYTIKSDLGLHTRPAARITSRAEKYTSKIDIKCKGQKLNGKSLMGMIALKARKGDVLEVTIEGEDEAAARDGLMEIFEEVLSRGIHSDADLPV